MNVLIADSRIPAARLLAADLRSRDVSVTLAVPEKNAESHPARPETKSGASALLEVFWNPFSWLSTESLVFEASGAGELDALVLLFDLDALSPFFSGLFPDEIFRSSVAAFQSLAGIVLKRCRKRRSGRIVFLLASGEKQGASPDMPELSAITAASAESAFIRFGEETAARVFKTEGSGTDVLLMKAPFTEEGVWSWAAERILSPDTGKHNGKWLSPSVRLGAIFQRRT